MHYPECWLSEPCEYWSDVANDWQTKDSHTNDQICSRCRNMCICEPVAKAFHRGWKMSSDNNKKITIDYGKRKYREGINDSWKVIDDKIDEYFHAVDFYQQSARQEVVEMLYYARESIAKLKDRKPHD